jgi:predicted unusual protein kinase regulating ubiquinone biosynthesis (AarF/ABC1/UbiB family)
MFSPIALANHVTDLTNCFHFPGNLLRTRDGRLCILDFGMMLETEPDLQYSLLEFVAHLTSDDFDRVPDDLVKLGFLKAEKLESVRASGFLTPLVYILKQAKKGGGGDKVRERIFDEFREKYPGMSDDELRVQMRSDMKQQMEEVRKRESAVTGITVEVEELQKQNRDAFTIPPWFLYTSRAFLTLEGVSLTADPNFSIIQSCFPYVARRLVGDDSPRAQKALRDLLYGAGNFVNVER